MNISQACQSEETLGPAKSWMFGMMFRSISHRRTLYTDGKLLARLGAAPRSKLPVVLVFGRVGNVLECILHDRIRAGDAEAMQSC